MFYETGLLDDIKSVREVKDDWGREGELQYSSPPIGRRLSIDGGLVPNLGRFGF